MNKKELDDCINTIFFDLDALELKNTKDNKYHCTLLRGNLEDIFKKLRRGLR